MKQCIINELSVGLSGLRLRLLPGAPYSVRYTPLEPVIGFAFEGQSGIHAFASDRARDYYARPNSMAYTPAGCAIYSESPMGGEYLTVSGAEHRITQLAFAEIDALPHQRFSNHVHAEGIHAAYDLRRLLLGGGAADPGRLETSVARYINAVMECGSVEWRPPRHAAS